LSGDRRNFQSATSFEYLRSFENFKKNPSTSTKQEVQAAKAGCHKDILNVRCKQPIDECKRIRQYKLLKRRKPYEYGKLGAGKTLMVISDAGHFATYGQLIGQRKDYEELMLELFRMYQSETVTTLESGIVSCIDKSSTQLLSANKLGYSLSLLAHSPDGNNETLYLNYVGKIVAVAKNGWALNVNPQEMPIEDYFDTSALTKKVLQLTYSSPRNHLRSATEITQTKYKKAFSNSICKGFFIY